MLLERNGRPVEMPTIDRSTGAMPGQHNRGRDKLNRLKRWIAENYPTTYKVLMGIAKIRDLNIDETITYTIINGENKVELNANYKLSIISAQSPLGAAIINKSAGDIVTVYAPNMVYYVEILEIT